MKCFKSSKKYLKHFITKLFEVELQLKEKLKVAIMILPTLRPTAAWGSQGWTVLCCLLCCTHRDYWSPEEVWRDIFELPAKAGSQGLAWAPCPGQPHSGPPFTRTPSRRPSHARGAVQFTAGSSRLLWATEWVESLWLLLSIAFSWSSTSTSFMMKCLRYFLLEILKKTVSP